jgi:hypothetical protein
LNFSFKRDATTRASELLDYTNFVMQCVMLTMRDAEYLGSFAIRANLQVFP